MIKFLVSVIGLFFLNELNSDAASCVGHGTVIIYGNGMFNSKVEASASGDALLFELNKKGLVDSKKPLVLDIAYKHSESLVEQLLHVAEQRGLDDFDNFWLWYTSSIEPPDWFKAALNKITTELLQKRTADFIDLDDHLKKYEDYIEKGYNVILVSPEFNMQVRQNHYVSEIIKN